MGDQEVLGFGPGQIMRLTITIPRSLFQVTHIDKSLIPLGLPLKENSVLSLLGSIEMAHQAITGKAWPFSHALHCSACCPARSFRCWSVVPVRS
jgi:hypothetical protein